MKNKNKKKQGKNDKKQEGGNEDLSAYEIIAVIASFVLLILVGIITYLLFDLVNSLPNEIGYTKEHIKSLFENIQRADHDESNFQDTKIILKSLENVSVSETIYEILVNNSIYEKVLYSIQTRSTICREKVHNSAVNKISELLTKVITSSGHKFECNTEFITQYFPNCYSQHDDFSSIFSLIETMSNFVCKSEVTQALIKASENSRDFYFKFRVIQSLLNNVKNESAICSLAENAAEVLPQDLSNDVKVNFCKFAKSYKCDVFKEQSIVDLCEENNKKEL